MNNQNGQSNGNPNPHRETTANKMNTQIKKGIAKAMQLPTTMKLTILKFIALLQTGLLFLWEKLWVACIWKFFGPVSAIVVFTATTLILFTSNRLDGPLASLGTTRGYLILSILQQLNTYAFLAAIDAAFSSIQWGPLMKRGPRLAMFLAISTSSGVPGWLKIFFHDIYSWPGVLSFLRVFFWGLVQFPGIVFVTRVDPVVDYIPVNWTPISGGIGVFNASMVSSRDLDNSQTISTLVMTLIKDRNFAIAADEPISEACAASSSCISYILPGGLRAVAPWPYLRTNDTTLSTYMTRNTPVYQVDFWTGPPRGIVWADGACSVYGTKTTGFQLCVSQHTVEGDATTQDLILGWSYCYGVITPDSECSNWEGHGWGDGRMWAIFAAIYRRKATIIADQSTGALLKTLDLTDPEFQNITAAEISGVFRKILNQFSKPDPMAIISPPNLRWWLTEKLGNILFLSASAPIISDPIDILRNLVLTPLHLYNPVTYGNGNETLLTLTALDTTQPGLTAENYISGSLARPISHLTVANWTRVVYAAVGGTLLFLVFFVIGFTRKDQMQKTSAFAVVDFATLDTKVSGMQANGQVAAAAGGQEQRKSVASLFENWKADDEVGLWRVVDGVKVYSKENP